MKNTHTILYTRDEGRPELLRHYSSHPEVEWLSSPLFSVELLPPLVVPDGVLLTTSAHALRWLAQATPRRDFLLYVVGDASEKTAKACGFHRVMNCHRHTGDEGARAILSYIKNHAPEDNISFHYLSGAEVHTDLADVLRTMGYEAERHVVYRMVPSSSFSAEVLARWDDIDAVMLMSRRAAEHFLSLVMQHGLPVHHMLAGCLSGKVAAAVEGAGFAHVRVAEKADAGALLRAVKDGIFFRLDDEEMEGRS